MIIIKHRINKGADLNQVPTEYGIEMDLKTDGKDIIVAHDPFQEGELFLDWIKNFKHNTLIANVKEEGLEFHVLPILKEHGITNFFFLDQSFPYIIKSSKQGIRESAVRFSEFESIETVMSLKGKIDWVWVDCFTKIFVSDEEIQKLKDAGFKVCLVSPELHGRETHEAEIKEFTARMPDYKNKLDAVCTKKPELWV